MKSSALDQRPTSLTVQVLGWASTAVASKTVLESSVERVVIKLIALDRYAYITHLIHLQTRKKKQIAASSIYIARKCLDYSLLNKTLSFMTLFMLSC